MGKGTQNRLATSGENVADPTSKGGRIGKERRGRSASPWPWGPFARILVSLLVLLHLAAVFSAPWSIQLGDILEPALPPGRIPRDAAGREIPRERLDIAEYPPLRPIVPQSIAGFFWHYANLLYINNGYDFFSPDPGVSFLIDYEVYDKQGEVIAKGRFPDRRDQWPRLFYHRHMMLADQSSSPMHERSGWELRIADWLLKSYEGESVRLKKVVHHFLTPQEVLNGRRLNEDGTYEVVGELTRQRSELGSDAASAPLPEPRVTIPGGG